MTWIPVEKNLPPDANPVLAFIKSNLTGYATLHITQYISEQWLCEWQGEYKVVYWQPIEPIPEKGK